jgi:hypothetical protein
MVVFVALVSKITNKRNFMPWLAWSTSIVPFHEITFTAFQIPNRMWNFMKESRSETLRIDKNKGNIWYKDIVIL